eukprot:CAMPEP_0195643564 /NCGR_PEP_ID=MMETSP0815-20121206/27904_1 /TAXON_ID=97485 /ORGANISM="Prymnesium parvum, Strain Texoma1" /LENGTH=51 /DNA_ID=CAMNT_0040786617 /DNA_START=666 /DNA_END=821 /DNA_ORIENTATION=-
MTSPRLNVCERMHSAIASRTTELNLPNTWDESITLVFFSRFALAFACTTSK